MFCRVAQRMRLPTGQASCRTFWLPHSFMQKSWLPNQSESCPHPQQPVTPALQATPTPNEDQEVGPKSPPSAAGVKPTRGASNSPVKVVEEGEEIKGQLTPGLLLTVTQGVRVHDHGRVVGELRAVCWTVEIPAGKDNEASLVLWLGRDI